MSKFKFIGEKTLIIDTLTKDKSYNILQFEHYKDYICIYLIDDNENVICIPYSNLIKFNENWKIIENN